MRTPIIVHLLLLASATFLVGCQEAAGGGGSDVVVVTDTDATDDDTSGPSEPIENTLARLNDQRELSGVPPLTVSDELSAGCQDHVAYMLGEAKVVHDQDPNSPHYTQRGAATGPNALIAGHVDSFGEAVDLWIIELYHRVNLLDPGVRQVGVAFDGGFACLDLFTAWEDPAEFPSVPWPAGGQSGVPTTYSPHSGLNPVPVSYELPTGPPISLMFSPDTVVGEGFKATLLDSDGALVDAFVRLPHDPTDPYAARHRNTIALIPLAPLAPGETWTVQMKGLIDDAQIERQWSFATSL